MPKASRLSLAPLPHSDETPGGRLARIRRERGFTQNELAENGEIADRTELRVSLCKAGHFSAELLCKVGHVVNTSAKVCKIGNVSLRQSSSSSQEGNLDGDF